MSAEERAGYFINGKAQIFEMLEHLSPDERSTLIHNVRMRNPQFADELQANSISFHTIKQLTDTEVRVVIQYVQAPIFGMALRTLDVQTKRRLLAIAPRAYAEKAYEGMTSRMNNEVTSIKRAQEKVKSVILGLVKTKQISA